MKDKATLLLFVTFFVFGPLFASDPGNVPPEDSDCSPWTEYRNRQPTGETDEVYVSGEDRKGYCTDPENSNNKALIYHTKKYAVYRIWSAEEWQVYPKNIGCPSDYKVRDVEKRGTHPVDYFRKEIVDIDCPYGGSSGGDDGDCLGVYETTPPEDRTSEFIDLTRSETEEIEDIDLPNQDGLNVVYERQSYWIPRPGYRPFTFDHSAEPSENTLTYLTRKHETTQSGCTEPGSVAGSSTTTQSLEDNEVTTTHTGWDHYVGRSPTEVEEGETTATSRSSMALYSYGPNGNKEVVVINTIDLSEPYSNTAFINDVIGIMPDFTNRYSLASSSAAWLGAGFYTHQSSHYSHISYSRIQFKFRWGLEVDNEDKFPTETYHILFTPVDDSTTEDVDERKNVEIVGNPVFWDGDGQESEVFEIDPAKLKRGKAGSFTLLKVDIAVDNNRDGTIEFGGGADLTEEEKPYTFWINNDFDDAEGDNPDGTTANYSDGVINGIRDLEDFTRLHIDVSSILPMLKDNDFDLALKFEETTGSPAIKLWKAKDPNNGSEDYLEDVSVAEQQIQLNNPGEIAGSTAYVIPQEFWDDLPDGTETAYLLYEGVSVGKGKLTLEIQKDGETIGSGPSVWLELKDIQSMYERAEATPNDLAYPYLTTSGYPQIPGISWTPKPDGFAFGEAWDEDTDNKNYIVFVHGWRMSYVESRNYAESFYKRLWHRGYKGRFAFFRWHTYNVNLSDEPDPTIQAMEAFLSDYNQSEYRAWKYGEAFRAYSEYLPEDYRVNVAAHSMGNVVVCSAMDQGASFENYIMLQAAIPATALDGRAELYQDPVDKTLFEVFGVPVTTPYWGFSSPDDHSNPAVRALSYKGQVPSNGTRVINGYLADDVATRDAWELNNHLFKPLKGSLSGSERGYRYNESETDVDFVLELYEDHLDSDLPPNPQRLRSVSDKHENMALLNQSRTKTVGAESRTAGVIEIESNVDLNTFGFGNVHSAEFVWEIQRLKGFYNMILERFRIIDSLKP